MAKQDPYDSDETTTYECTECQHRFKADDHPGECPNCGGSVQNIARPREK